MEKTFARSDWELQETSTYKALRHGATAVSNLEILTSLVDSREVATRILNQFQSLRNLAIAGMHELMVVEGVSQVTALRIVGCFELGRRKFIEEKPLKITTSEAVANFMKSTYVDLQQEVFTVLYLNRNNEIIAEDQLFTGGISAVIVDPRIVYHKAIQHLASAIILVHNHPSGNLTPSQHDRDITRKIQEVGKLLDIMVLDHIILSHRGYFSFADEGVM